MPAAPAHKHPLSHLFCYPSVHVQLFCYTSVHVQLFCYTSLHVNLCCCILSICFDITVHYCTNACTRTLCHICFATQVYIYVQLFSYTTVHVHKFCYTALHVWYICVATPSHLDVHDFANTCTVCLHPESHLLYTTENTIIPHANLYTLWYIMHIFEHTGPLQSAHCAKDNILKALHPACHRCCGKSLSTAMVSCVLLHWKAQRPKIVQCTLLHTGRHMCLSGTGGEQELFSVHTNPIIDVQVTSVLACKPSKAHKAQCAHKRDDWCTSVLCTTCVCKTSTQAPSWHFY